MKKFNLKAEKRTVVGKKVKNLRKEAILPATVYGKDVQSVSIQLPIKEFEKVYKEAGETGVIYLEIGSEKARPVLIKYLQQDPRYGTPLHTDFYQVNLSEKVTAMIPIIAVGEPKAIQDTLGELLTPTTEIEVEALPTELAENIEVEISQLAAINDQITVADIKAPSGVTILTDPGQILFRIGEIKVEDPEPTSEVAEGTEGEQPTQGPVEGEEATPKGTEEKTPEEKKE